MGFWGVGPDTTGHLEKLLSAAGGFIGILLTMWVSHHYLGVQGAAMLVASMGASAVLLFAAPHGALSQPWPVLGGHLVSALIGVTIARVIPDILIAAPLSVALAIAAMYYLRCIHPPGGATAISAVIGSSELHALGYHYVLTPVLLNVVILLVVAVALNYAFPWRRYPVSFRKAPAESKAQDAGRYLRHEDFAYALNELGTYIDIDENDLSNIYRLAAKHAWQLSDLPEQITEGLYYSNGEMGEAMSVRKVLSCDEGVVHYRIVEGEGTGHVGSDKLDDFSSWQKYEVIPKNGSWHRILSQPRTS